VGRPYIYQSDGSSYVLKSLGADRRPGGAGKDADIDSSQIDSSYSV
jgi:general secretion pathway protein G